MWKYILGRVWQALIVVIIVSVAVFLMLHMIPGDPVTILAGPDPSQEQVDALRKKFGLDQPLVVQYFKWAWSAVQGDLGTSVIIGRPVTEMLAQRLPATLELAIAAIIVASVFGILIGIISAQNRDSWIDRGLNIFNAFLLSTPNFWFGVLGIMVFAIYFDILPSGGRKSFAENPLQAIQYLILPAVTLSLDSIAMIARLVRASVLDELGRDYVVAARAKGVGRAWLMRRHVGRNAAMPVLTVLGLRFGQMLGGAVLIESVFNWPGLGRLTIEAIKNRDVVVVQGALMYFVIIYMVINLVIDLSYGWFNPRVRASMTGGK